MNAYEHRRGTVTLKIIQPDGTPVKNREVVIRQTKHKFLFGCAEFSVVPLANDELQGEDKQRARIFSVNFWIYSILPLYLFTGAGSNRLKANPIRFV